MDWDLLLWLFPIALLTFAFWKREPIGREPPGLSKGGGGG